MFVSDYIEGKKIIKSSLIDEIDVFFTTRESCIYSKEEDRTFMKERVENFLGQKLATNHPVHGVDIEEVIDNKYFYKDVDGLLLKKGKAGFLNFGDCVPLVFYAKGVGLISHAGWRGTAKCMAKVSVERLIKETHCEAKDIKAIIGPSICFKCYKLV